MNKINTFAIFPLTHDHILVPDSIFLIVNVPFLHGRLRHLGVSRGPVLSKVLAVGQFGPFGSPGRRHHHSSTGFFLVRHRLEHRGPHFSLRLRRGYSVRAEFPDQLGRADVPREDGDPCQSEDHHFERGVGLVVIFILFFPEQGNLEVSSAIG